MGEHLKGLLVALAFFVFVSTTDVRAGSVSSAGVCPYLPSPTSCRDNYNFCQSDGDCRVSSFKCCSNGCNRICADAVPSKTVTPTATPPIQRTRPGNCPALPIRKYCFAKTHDCSNDFDCKEFYKCCSNGCVKRCHVATIKKAIENGFSKKNATCPHFPTNSINCPQGSSNQCEADNQCTDQGSSFKCCWDGCRKICIDPSEIQQTEDISFFSCPIVRRPEKCPTVAPKNTCNSIADCGRGQRCCSDGCHLRCFGKDGFEGATEGPNAIKPLLSAAEVVFVMDTSDGPRGSEFELQKSFATSLTRFFDLGPNKVHVAIVSSGQTTTVVKYLSPYVTRPGFESYVKRLGQQTESRGGRALDTVFNVIQRDILSAGRPSVPHIVIIFSFGLPSSSVWNLLKSARGLHNQGVKVFTVGVDVQENEPQLRAVVSRPQDMFTFRNARHMEGVESMFASHVVSRTEDVVPEQFDADLVFLLDSSDSVGRINLKKVKNFVLSMARALNFNPSKSRASIVTFGDVVAEVTANLGDYTTIGSLSIVIEKMVYLGGDARITSSLDIIHKILDRARPHVRKVALMITDGQHLPDSLKTIYQTMKPLRLRELEMYALVVKGGQEGAKRLAGLTSRSTDIFTASNYDELPSLVAPIAKYIVNGPPPTTASPTTTPPTTTTSAPPTTTSAPPTTTSAPPTTTSAPPTTTSAPPTPTSAPTTTTSAPPTTTSVPPPTTSVPTTPTTKEQSTTVATEAPTTTHEETTTETPTTEYVAAGNIPTTAVRVTKPGRCPYIPSLAECLIRQCFDDLECDGVKKCCSGCCVKPQSHVENAPAKGRPKPGICPMISRLGITCPNSDQCGVDQDCAGSKKCCAHFCRRMICVEPPSKEEEQRLMNRLYRPGRCPSMKTNDFCQKKNQVECNYDVDCRTSATQKCCSDGCHRKCINPVGLPVIPHSTSSPVTPAIIPGRCPPYSPVKSCPKLVQDSCTCSSDCAKGFKCCFDGCKRICRKAAGEVCAAQIDIVYLMDTSGSISLSDYRLEKQFVKDLARIFRIGVDASQAAAIIYNDDPHMQIKLGEHKSEEDFAKAVDKIPYLHGRTRIDKALKASVEIFQHARPTVRKVLVLLTDGRQTQDPDAVDLGVASQPLKDMGVKIYAVGVGHKINESELRQITPDVFTVKSFSALLGESQTIAEKACGDVIGKICVRGVDLGFIVDSSESITDDDFVKEKVAIKAISDEFIIAPKSTRVGVVIYSEKPAVSISFGQHSSNPEFNRAVNTLPHMQSNTRLDLALRHAANNLYNKRRQGNPAIAIVMTDGRSTPGSESLSSAVQPLRDLGVRVFAVGVGPRVSQKDLKQLVERYDDIYTVDSFSALIEEAKKVTQRACPAPSETILPPATTPTPSPVITVPPTKPSKPANLCSYFLDIIFVLDSSRSMDVRQYQKQKEFVIRMSRIFNVGKGSRAAVIIYSDDPILSITFDQFIKQEDFLDGIQRLPYIMQRTRIDKALQMASTVLLDSRPGFPKAVIIMTDGKQTRDPDYVPLNVAAAPLHNAGARVLVVGIGPQISVPELRQMVKNDTGDVFTVESFDSLVNAASDVAVKSCQGPIPTQLPESCSDAFDLAFVMDSSGSMLSSSYEKEKNFVKNVAGRFPVGPSQVEVALLSFSDFPNTLVAFGTSASVTPREFNAAVNGAMYVKGRTRIDRALESASVLYKFGRPSVPRILVFLTDGRQSSDPGFTPLKDAVKPLIDQDVKIIVVGIGQDIDRKQLLDLANGQARDVTQISSFDDLDRLKNSFPQTICRKVEEIIQRYRGSL